MYRRNSILHDYPIVEVVGFTAITAAVSYLVSVDIHQDQCYSYSAYLTLLAGRVSPCTIFRACRQPVPRVRSLEA